MATVVTQTSVSITESRSTRRVFDLRSSFSDISEYQETSVEMAYNQTRTYRAATMACIVIRDAMTVTITHASGSMTLTGVSGGFSLPFPCTITLSTSAVVTDFKSVVTLFLI